MLSSASVARATVLLCLLGALCTGAPAAPPPEEPLAEEEIVVTGSRNDPKETHRQAKEFVSQSGIASGQRPTARWFDRVCPKVMGLTAPHDGIVETRMRDIARLAGIPLADSPCTPNITVSFVEDGGAFMAALVSKRGMSLRETPPAERKALVSGDRPIRWFYTAETRSRDGDPGAAGHPGAKIEGGGDLTVPAGAESLAQKSAGSVGTGAARALTSATVVIEAKRVEGLPLTAVAAYSALVAFAELRPGDPPPDRSILALFANEDNERILTGWDSALLRTLYQMPMDREARRQRGRLVHDLALAASNRGARRSPK